MTMLIHKPYLVKETKKCGGQKYPKFSFTALFDLRQFWSYVSFYVLLDMVQNKNCVSLDYNYDDL